MWQRDRVCASALVLLHAPESDVIRHAHEAPANGGFDTAVSWADAVAGREVRTVDGVDIQDADAVGPPEVDAWVRVLGATEDLLLNQALLIHASAGFLIGAALRPHAGLGQSMAHRDISTGILGHTVSFHEEPDLRDWVLLTNESPYAGHGRAFGRGQAFSRSGQLLASYSQEAMIRSFPEGQSIVGREATIF
jgi:acyl-CoA thioesterase-2